MIHDSRDNFGGYLEDFVPGDVFKHWPGKTVTEMDNDSVSSNEEVKVRNGSNTTSKPASHETR